MFIFSYVSHICLLDWPLSTFFNNLSILSHFLLWPSHCSPFKKKCFILNVRLLFPDFKINSNSFSSSSWSPSIVQACQWTPATLPDQSPEQLVPFDHPHFNWYPQALLVLHGQVQKAHWGAGGLREESWEWITSFSFVPFPNLWRLINSTSWAFLRLCV